MILDIQRNGDFSQGLAAKIQQALDRALANDHKLTDLVKNIEGMSGQVYRKFINNLIESLDAASYLEVGSLKGSTACAAMFNNTAAITCIDNWHWNHREKFIENTTAVKTDKNLFRFIHSDFRQVNYHDIGQYQVYLFDGPHSVRDQYDGVILAQPALAEEYCLIVDDWNDPAVRTGTAQALLDLNAKIIAAIEIRTTLDNSYPKVADHFSDWHNGYYIAHIKKL